MSLTIVLMYSQSGLMLVWICRWEQTQGSTCSGSISLGVAMPVFLTTSHFPCHSQVLPPAQSSFRKTRAPKLLGRIIFALLPSGLGSRMVSLPCWMKWTKRWTYLHPLSSGSIYHWLCHNKKLTSLTIDSLSLKWQRQYLSPTDIYRIKEPMVLKYSERDYFKTML